MAIKKGVQYTVIKGENVRYRKEHATKGITRASLRNTAYDVVDIIERAGLPIGVMDTTAYELKDSYFAQTSCLPTDQFDEEKGKDVAKRKCLMKYNADKVAKIDKALSHLRVLVERLERQKKIATERMARDAEFLANRP